MDIRVETLSPLDIICSVSLGSYPHSAPKAWEQLFTALKDIDDISPKQMIGFGMDDPFTTPEPLIRYVAAISYEGDSLLASDGPLHKMKLAGGKYAVYTMQGSYQNMPDIFAKLKNEWLPDSGYCLDFTRPFLEIYLNDPCEVEEKDYLTDLHLPIK